MDTQNAVEAAMIVADSRSPFLAYVNQETAAMAAMMSNTEALPNHEALIRRTDRPRSGPLASPGDWYGFGDMGAESDRKSTGESGGASKRQLLIGMALAMQCFAVKM
jgi:hypothetical protein